MTGLKLEPKTSDQSKLVGITARNPDGFEEHLDGSLIVDASGPTSLGVKLLSRLPQPVIVHQSSYDPGQMYRSIILPVSEKIQDMLAEEGYIAALGTRATKWTDAGFIAFTSADYLSLGQRFGYTVSAYDGGRGMSVPFVPPLLFTFQLMHRL